MDQAGMRPGNESELAEALRQANGPLKVRGGGTRGFGRSTAGTVLQTGGLSGISLYEPGALTIVAGAGTPLAEVQAALAAEGQHLPFEVPDMTGLMDRSGVSTIGGVVAANASGPRRVQAGACRDSLIGVRFVDGTGTVVKNGGRVMKNVTGYDLVKLMAGSHGTLGVLSEVSFKVLPRPETQATLLLPGLDDAAGVAALSRALASPFEVSGAAHLPGEGTFLRIEGFEGSVGYRAGQLQRLLGGELLGPEASDARWIAIRDVAGFHGQTGDVWRLSVTPTAAPAIVARAGAEAALYDWGGGLVWLRIAPGTDLRARLGTIPGHASLVRAAPATLADVPAFPPESGPLAALTAGLRARFDPKGILNSGLMG
jgi:glycolate oxidase FAD binding subunit